MTPPRRVGTQRAPLALGLAVCALLVCALHHCVGTDGPARFGSPIDVDGAHHGDRGRPDRIEAPIGAPAGANDGERVACTADSPSAARSEGAPRAEDAGCASLAGRITRHGVGTNARVCVELERGERLEIECDGSGAFQRGGIVPGFHRVTVELPGGATCTRSLFLRPYTEGRLDLDFGRTVLVSGRVRGPSGAAITDADVLLDGARTTTNGEGGFTLGCEASGTAELLVRAPGCAWFTCAVRRDATAPLEIELEPACSLEVRLPARLRGEESVVYVLPGDVERTSGRPLRPATPWHLFSPLRGAQGSACTFEHLPPGEVVVRVLVAHGAARAERVILAPDHPALVEPRGHAAATARAAREDGAVRDALGAAGLGALPRSQPLAARPTGGR